MSEYLNRRLIENCLTVVDNKENELHLLNPSASVLFLLLEEGGLVSDIVNEYVKFTGLDDKSSINTLDRTLKEWKDKGWVKEERNYLYLGSSFTNANVINSKRSKKLDSSYPIPEAISTETLYINLGNDACCKLELSVTEKNGYIDAIPRLKAILSSVQTHQTNFISTIRFLIDGDNIYITCNDEQVQTIDESFGLSTVATYILKTTYSKDHIYATMHAAAVRKADTDIIMPGSSGSGKSTLTAYLSANSWTYLGDDVLALGYDEKNDNTMILPFCTSLGLKPGSWKLLNDIYPIIDSTPIIPYADRRAKFIKMTSSEAFSISNQKIVIVFPKYHTSIEKSELFELSTLESFERIINSGLTLGLTIQTSNLDKTIDFITKTECYELCYSDLETARIKLNELINE